MSHLRITTHDIQTNPLTDILQDDLANKHKDEKRYRSESIVSSMVSTGLWISTSLFCTNNKTTVNIQSQHKIYKSIKIK